jgi:Ser/Thr protein kinase RdoA (MazF antagonist)
MVAAFDRQVRLTDAERDVLPDLIAARFAQRILINQWLDRRDPGHDSLHDANLSALTALLDLEA